jgi:hypothetical protein
MDIYEYTGHIMGEYARIARLDPSRADGYVFICVDCGQLFKNEREASDHQRDFIDSAMKIQNGELPQ